MVKKKNLYFLFNFLNFFILKIKNHFLFIFLKFINLILVFRESFKRITEIYLPEKPRNFPCFNILADYNEIDKHLYIVENE
jgi:hypothetical protein